MSTQQIILRLPPRRWQQYLEKLESRVKTRSLLHILDSFPLSTTFDFYEANLQEHEATRLFLGQRKQTNGVLANVWAYVLSGHSEVIPSVVFRDEEPTNDDEIQLYPRAASSLLRRAIRLHPPFCFLQFNPHDRPTNVRGMLCALVAYYFLSAGIDDCALNWTDFEVCLFKALEYIANRTEYQQWQQGQVDQSTITLDAQAAPVEKTLQMGAEEAGGSSLKDGDMTHEGNNGTVRSMGSSIKAKTGSTLAKLKKHLGGRVSLLDEIPETPITISRQSRYPTYFPFRLHFGTHRPSDAAQSSPVDVYVYLTHNGRNDVRILGHEANGNEWSWKFHTLQDVQPFAPFAPFTRPTTLGVKSQGNKIRTLVYYYFMLAENKGLVDNPRLRVYDGMVHTLCSACKDFQKEGHGLLRSRRPTPESDTNDAAQGSFSDAYTENMDWDPDSAEKDKKSLVVKLKRPAPASGTDDTVQGSSSEAYSENIVRESESAEKDKKSLIVKLKFAELVTGITGTTIPSQRTEVPDSESDEDTSQLEDPREPSILSAQETQVARSIEPEASSKPKPDDSLHAAIELGAKLINLSYKGKQGGLSRDSGFVSSSESPLMFPSNGLSVASQDHDAVRLDDQGEESPVSNHILNIRTGQTGQDYSEQNLLQPSNNPFSRTLFDRDSPVSVISINSSHDSEHDHVSERLFPIGLPPTTSPPMTEYPTHESRLTRAENLRSDDEDSVLLEPPKPGLEQTPEPLPVSYPSRTTDDQADYRPDHVPSRDPKRNLDNLYDKFDDDVEEVEEVEWMGASWSRAQAKRLKEKID